MVPWGSNVLPDRSPFVCGYVLDGQGSAQSVEAAEVDAWSCDQGPLWLHLDVSDSEARQWLLRRSDVPSLMAEALLAGETRPRVVLDGNGLLVVLRGVNTNAGSDPDDMVSVRVWIDSNRIISSRRRRLLSIQDIRDSFAEGHGPKTPGGFVVTLVERLADRIGGVVEQLEDSIDAAEEQNLALESLRGELGSLRRQTASIRRYLAPQRDALDKLYRQPGALFTDTEAQEVREQSDRMTRYLEDLDLARERAMVLQEELLSRMAHEQNARMYLLSVVAAIFLPLTFVAGLLGMNLAGMPGTSSPWAFSVSLILMGVLGAGLGLFFKWKKWI
jgi:zinc transporter